MVTAVSHTLLLLWQPKEVTKHNSIIIQNYEVEGYTMLLYAMAGVVQASIEQEVGYITKVFHLKASLKRYHHF